MTAQLTPMTYISTGEARFAYTSEKGERKVYEYEGVTWDTWSDACELATAGRLKEAFNLLRRFGINNTRGE